MAAAAAEAGVELPTSPGGSAKLWDVSVPYWRAFQTLSRSRGYAVGMSGGSPLAVPYSEISAYAKDHGLAATWADLEDTVELVQALDDAYLKHHGG